MAPPTYSNGQILNASDCNSWFTPLAGYKTADLARTSTTQSADPDLTIPVAANGVYWVEAFLGYKSSTTGDIFQWGWSFPGGGGGLYHALYTGGGGLFVSETELWSDTGHSAGSAVANTVYPVTFRGKFANSSTAGNLSFLWAAKTSGTTTLTNHSVLTARRIG